MAELVSVSPKSPDEVEEEVEEEVEYENVYGIQLFSDVAGPDFKTVDGVYFPTFGGGPEGGYVWSADGFLYFVRRDWFQPFTMKKISYRLVMCEESSGYELPRIRRLNEGEEMREDEFEFLVEGAYADIYDQAMANNCEASSPKSEDSNSPKSVDSTEFFRQCEYVPCSGCDRTQKEGAKLVYKFFGHCVRSHWYCIECYLRMPEDVKTRLYCGLCKACHFGKFTAVGKDGKLGLSQAELDAAGTNSEWKILANPPDLILTDPSDI
jgi:hypothetical protein